MYYIKYFVNDGTIGFPESLDSPRPPTNPIFPIPISPGLNYLDASHSYHSLFFASLAEWFSACPALSGRRHPNQPDDILGKFAQP